MPKLSDSMEEAVILPLAEGGRRPLLSGEGLAEIETDKATVVFEAESDGVIASIVVAEGEAARVGETIATLGTGPARRPRPPGRRARRRPPPAT